MRIQGAAPAFQSECMSRPGMLAPLQSDKYKPARQGLGRGPRRSGQVAPNQAAAPLSNGWANTPHPGHTFWFAGATSSPRTGRGTAFGSMKE
ncbi:hypothetical protein GCM10022279_16220 [Comamonas faecalis]|uniref:Uncharacterized protein n=1 Tax=Comamonas faecalis TaxID=1387849 RepID=A0ABP7R768_9BURK